MSCWPTRHATATNGRPDGARGIRRFPNAASSSATMATRPMPQRLVERPATIAPMNDEAPPTPAMRPTAAALSPSSSSANRNHVAPNTPQSAAIVMELRAKARRTGWSRTTRRPMRISSSTGSRSAGGGGGGPPGPVGRRGRWRLRAPDRQEQHGRDDIGHGIDEDRDGPRQRLDEETADPESDELRDGAAGGQGAVRLDESVLLDDRRQVGVVRCVEERREDGGQDRDDEELQEAEGAQGEGDGDRAEERRPSEVRPDQDRPPAQAVHPCPGDEADDEDGEEIRAPEQRHLDRARAERQDGDERQGDAGDERPEDGDRRRRPHPDERAVLPERAAERVGHGRRSIRA